MSNNNKREWTDDQVANLMQLYEEHEFLWNVKHTLHRNREKKWAYLTNLRKM